MIKRQLHLCLLLPIKKPQEKVIQRWAQSPKKPFLAKKCPKNAVFLSWGLRLATYCKSDSGLWKFRFFSYNKVVLVFGFLAKIQKRHFLPEKMPFFTFGWVFPFSMAFLSSQTSLFAPNFRNQVRKPDFGRALPLRLNTLQKAGKNQKTVLPDTFSWFDGFQHTK